MTDYPHRGAIVLRPDQEHMVSRVYASIRSGSKAILVQSQTGVGKGHMIAAMLADCASKGKRAAVVTHLSEINRDLIQRIRSTGIEPRVLMGSAAEGPADSLVWVVSEQTAARRGLALTDVRLCIRDEAHRQQSCSALTVAAACPPDAIHVGFTATPARGDGKPLDFYKVLHTGAQVQELVAAGILCPMRAFSPVRVGKGLAQDPVAIWPRYPSGQPRPGIVFAHSVAHSEELAQRFRTERGWTAQHLDAKTPNRAAAIDRFNAGEIDILCNWRLLQEGADLRRSEVTMAATEIGHVGIQQQMCGRSRRLFPGKVESYFWDLCNNIARLRHHPDGDLLYSLDGAEGIIAQEPAPGAIPQRCCPECWAWQRSGPPRCIYCLAPVPPPPMPCVSERAMREARLEQIHARQALKGPEWEKWRAHVLQAHAKGKAPGKIMGAWIFAGNKPRYTIRQVLEHEGIAPAPVEESSNP